MNTVVSAALLSAAIFSLFSCGMNGGKPGGSTGTDTGTTAAGDSGKSTETNLVMVVFDMKFLQQNLEMILCRQAGIGQISFDVRPVP